MRFTTVLVLFVVAFVSACATTSDGSKSPSFTAEQPISGTLKYSW